MQENTSVGKPHDSLDPMLIPITSIFVFCVQQQNECDPLFGYCKTLTISNENRKILQNHFDLNAH